MGCGEEMRGVLEAEREEGGEEADDACPRLARHTLDVLYTSKRQLRSSMTIRTSGL